LFPRSQCIEESSRLLTKTRDEYRGLQSVITTSRRILGRLERGDLTDRLLIAFGLVVFSLVVLSILRGRIPGVRYLWSWLWDGLTGWLWVMMSDAGELHIDTGDHQVFIGPMPRPT
jgi:protein transport protein SEC20